MTSKTGQMSVRPSVCPWSINIFKTLELRDRWADVDETWHVHSVGLGTNFTKWNSEFWPHGGPELREMTHPERDASNFLTAMSLLMSLELCYHMIEIT